MNSVHVDLGDRSYEILVEPGLLSQTGERILAAGLKGRAAIITDTNVAPHYLEKVEASLADAGYETSTHVAEAGEAS
ncbi:3-dehydroquinate synthase, partial [Akkermansiaceae bacterium]|nr:3-dehydroquinate synthase [Akkermansiaceae bacterium]